MDKIINKHVLNSTYFVDALPWLVLLAFLKLFVVFILNSLFINVLPQSNQQWTWTLKKPASYDKAVSMMLTCSLS